MGKSIKEMFFFFFSIYWKQDKIFFKINNSCYVIKYNFKERNRITLIHLHDFSKILFFIEIVFSVLFFFSSHIIVVRFQFFFFFHYLFVQNRVTKYL